MARRNRWLLGLFLLALGTPAQAENRALLVGVGQYRQPGANLPGIDIDVALMKQAALKLGFRESEIKVLRDSDATLAAIRSAFQSWLTSGVSSGDRVMFYFSGHGSYVRDQNGDEPDGTDEVLLPTDFHVVSGGLENALVDDDLGVLLDRIPTRSVYVFLDACHSGTATRALGDDIYVSKSFEYPGMPEPKPVPAGATRSLASKALDTASQERHVVLTASTERERAQASKQGSLFTQAVLDAVTQAAAQGRTITPQQIRDSADRFIAAHLAQKPSLIHHPTAYGDSALLRSAIISSQGTGVGSKPAPAAVAPTASAAAAPPPATSAPVAAATPPPRPAPPAPAVATGPVWKDLETTAKQGAWAVKVTPRKPAYRVGENLVIDVAVPSDGFLNVLNVGAGETEATVLFPNQHQPDNAVRAGQKVTIGAPGGPFELPAGLPPGQSEQKTLLVVIHTRNRLSAFDAGSGSGFLRALTGSATRSFSVKAVSAESGGFGAGQAVVVIRQR